MAGPTPFNITAFSYSAANQTVVTTAETVIATLSGINSRSVGNPINLNGFCVVTLGASTTSIVLRVRQDSVTGTVVGASSSTSTAQATLATVAGAIEVQDNSAVEYSNKTYVMTVVCTAATANSTVVAATLAAVY